jgi:hypothetical protein
MNPLLVHALLPSKQGLDAAIPVARVFRGQRADLREEFGVPIRARLVLKGRPRELHQAAGAGR